MVCYVAPFSLCQKMRNIPVGGCFMSLGFDIKIHGVEPQLTHDENAE